MSAIHSEIAVIGGGLTGLVLANLLQKNEQQAIILEARNRLGGRIYTHYEEGLAPTEMGATWLGKKHTALVELLEELDIGIFEQLMGDRAIYHPISTSPPQLVQLPENTDPSYRIQGGSSALIDQLGSKLDPGRIFWGNKVASIERDTAGFLIQTDQQEFHAKKVVSTLPPNLLVSTVSFSPELPPELLQVARQTHTWMGESIKVSLAYEKPFWRASNLSGTIVSNVGPIPEMYDHSNVEDDRFALKGFLNGNYFSLTKAERLELVLNQLEQYYGSQVRDFLKYDERIWRNEGYTFHPYASHVLPHQNNGHAVFQEAYLGGNFYIAGSETSTLFPGYMDGAVRSAQWVFQKING